MNKLMQGQVVGIREDSGYYIGIFDCEKEDSLVCIRDCTNILNGAQYSQFWTRLENLQDPLSVYKKAEQKFWQNYHSAQERLDEAVEEFRALQKLADKLVVIYGCLEKQYAKGCFDGSL